MRIIKTILLTIGSILVIFILVYAGLGIFVSSKVKALPMVDKYLDRLGRKIDGENYLFNDKSGNYIVFPANNNTKKGIIIYPAAFADEKSYIPFAFNLADVGYSVFIAKMPFGLSMLNPENGLNFTDNFKDIKKWYVIGHSMGGAAASVFVKKHPGIISGLIFWASMPLSDMKNIKIKMLHFFATKDGFFSKKSLENAKKLLPSDTIYYTVEGGNHSQFAWYPDMPGDLRADISREEQQKQVIKEVTNYLQQAN